MHSKDQLSHLIDKYILDLNFPSRPTELYSPIRYSLEGGGKRIRPLTVLMVGDAFGGNVTEMLHLAAAVEVFHNFTLLHDDIMDNADVRRGMPSVHARWGANTAILSGDVMLIFAYKLLALNRCGEPGPMLDQFNMMAIEVCEGQQYDMEFEERSQVDEHEYMEMISLKTAALIARAARMGAMAAGASEEDFLAMYRFGYELGIAFQLQDDLLDSYGDDPAFGKKPGGDIIEGKKNFLAVTALARGSELQRNELGKLLTDNVMGVQDKVALVRKLYDALGIKQITEDKIKTHITLSIEALAQVSLPEERLAPLRELALGMLNRKK